MSYLWGNGVDRKDTANSPMSDSDSMLHGTIMIFGKQLLDNITAIAKVPTIGAPSLLLMLIC